MLKNFIVKGSKILSFFLLGIVFANFNVNAQSLKPIPKLTGPVVDTVGVLDPSSILTLEKKILQLQESKGSQVQVLIVDSTQPESIEQYSIRLAEAWKIGRKKIDDGVILLIALEDRKARIEVGYGLEGTIPDALASRIIRNILAPYFREKKYSEGIEKTIDTIIELIQGEDLPKNLKNDGYTAAMDKQENNFPSFLYLLAIFLAIFFSGVGLRWLSILSFFSLVTTAQILGGSPIFLAFILSLLFTLLVSLFLFSKGSSFVSSRGGFPIGGGWGGGLGGGGFGGGGWSGGGGGFGGGGASGSW